MVPKVLNQSTLDGRHDCPLLLDQLSLGGQHGHPVLLDQSVFDGRHSHPILLDQSALDGRHGQYQTGWLYFPRKFPGTHFRLGQLGNQVYEKT